MTCFYTTDQEFIGELLIELLIELLDHLLHADQKFIGELLTEKGPGCRWASATRPPIACPS